MVELHWTRWLNALKSVLDWSIMKKKTWKKPRMENPYNLKYSKKNKRKKRTATFFRIIHKHIEQLLKSASGMPQQFNMVIGF